MKSFAAKCRPHLVSLIFICLLSLAAVAWAQDPQKAEALSKQEMAGLIAAAPQMLLLKAGMPTETDAEVAELEALLETVARNHGFTNIDHFNEVTEFVSIVMTGIDPKTKAFTEPKVVLERQIGSVTQIVNDTEKAMRLMSGSEATTTAAKLKSMRELLHQLQDAYRGTPARINPTSVALVKEYFDRIVVAMNPPRPQ
jgi:hypothetical protein